MTTRIYKSTDTGAPALTGQIDSLNNLLKAILVNGIGGAPASPWSVAFEDVASHTVAFRAAGGNRAYFTCQDNGPGAATYKEARLRGYTAMTAYNAGTNPFPSTTQQANGIIARKSATLDATVRAWRAFVDEKTFYLFIDCGDVAGTWDLIAFGDFLDWTPAGAFGSLITGRTSENSTTHTSTTNGLAAVIASGTTTTKVYGPRDYTQTGSAVEYSVLFDSAAVNTTTSGVPGSFGQAYPYPVDNGLMLMPARLALAGLPCGRFRGLWLPGHNRALVQDDIFSAVEGTLTRNFQVQNFLSTGQLFMETGSTWDTE